MTTQNNLQLVGQVAAVTGGGRGIGRAIAATLSAAGATTAVLARSASEIDNTARLIEQAGGRARPFIVDVTDAVTVERTFAEIERSLGDVTLLVNNAALPGPIGPFCETDADQWWQTLNVNLRGAMLCARAVLPGMISRRKGRIINIASSQLPVAYFSSYATSKAALVRFTETIAAEVKPHGISMFAVGPGTVRTPMAKHSLRSAEGQRWLPWFKRIFDEGLDVPAERPARLVLELAAGRADSLSGRFISVRDDLDSLLRNAKQIEEQNLYSLRVQTLEGHGEGHALSAIHADAERGNNADSVAEHVLLFILALLRQLPAAQANLNTGTLGAPFGRMLAGRTVCLYRLGATAMALTRRLRPMGVRLIGNHGVSRDQLQVYLDEFVFRHNRRRLPIAAFQTLLGLGTGRKPT